MSGELVVICVILFILLISFLLQLRTVKWYKTAEKKSQRVEENNKRLCMMLQFIPYELLEYSLKDHRLYSIDKKTGMPCENEKRETIYPGLKDICKNLTERFQKGEEVIVETIEGYRMGQPRFGKFTATAILSDFGFPVRVICTIEDITEAMGKSMEMKDKLMVALENTYDIVYEIDLNQNRISTLFSKNHDREIYPGQSVPFEEYMKLLCENKIKEDSKKLFSATMKIDVLRAKVSQTQSVYIEYDGLMAGKDFHRQSMLLQNGDWSDGIVVAFIKDIDHELKEKEILLLKSELDPMTGLLNKETFFKKAKEILSKNEHSKYAVIFLDLDFFKKLNDTLGHMMGDEAICDTAEIIKQIFEETALIGRFGGDEFCVMLSFQDRDNLIILLQKLKDTLQREYHSEGKSVQTFSSMGIAISPDDATGFDELLGLADQALYRAKNTGKNQFVFYR